MSAATWRPIRDPMRWPGSEAWCPYQVRDCDRSDGTVRGGQWDCPPQAPGILQDLSISARLPRGEGERSRGLEKGSLVEHKCYSRCGPRMSHGLEVSRSNHPHANGTQEK